MEMDKNILNLMSLVGEMSAEITTIKEEMEDMKKEIAALKGEGVNSFETEDAITVSNARDYVIEQIKKRYPHLKLTKGSQKLGAKLTISNGEKTLRVLLKKSRSHRIKEGYPSGWFTVNEDAVGTFDLYIFVITFEDKFHTILLSPEQFKAWANVKHITSENIHFYMNLINGVWIDDRDDVNYDFTFAAEKWTVIEEVLKGK
jgi:hypothetical protein